MVYSYPFFSEEVTKPLLVDQGTETVSEELPAGKSGTVDQGTDSLSKETPETTKSLKVDQGTVESKNTTQPLRVDQATETEDMGSGASKDSEVIDDDDQYVQQPERKRSTETEQSGPSTPPRNGLKQRPSISRQLTNRSVNNKESSRTNEKNDVLRYIGKTACFCINPIFR